MIEKMPAESQQRLTAMMGLAASEADKIGACPSEEELAAFLDGELQGPAYKAMQGHLSRCPDCYYRWQEVTEFLESVESEPEKQQQPAPIITFRQRLETWFQPWKIALPAAVAAALIMLVVLVPGAPDIGQRIDAQYASEVQFSEALTITVQGLPLPWEAAALGFNQPESGLPSRAFGAGVWSGQTRLIGEDEKSLPETFSPPDKGLWSESQWADYYHFGRWAVLLWALTNSQQISVDWGEHKSIAVSLQTRMKEQLGTEQVTRMVVRELHKIEQLITAASDKEPGSYTRLSRKLVLMIQQLAPSAL